MKKTKEIELPVDPDTEFLIKYAGRLYGYNIVNHEKFIVKSGLGIKKYSEILRCYEINPNWKQAFWTAYRINLAIQVTNKLID